MLNAILQRARLLLPFLVLGLVLVSLADGDGGGAPKIKVLIVEGVTNHAWEKRLNIVRAILAKDGSFDVDFTVSPTAAGDPAWESWRPKFSDYDVVISGYNNLGGLPTWPQEAKDSFAAYVHGGGGFYAFHEANNSFAEWPQYNQIIGLGWRDKSFGKAITVNADGSLNEIPAGAGENTGHGARQDVLVTKRGAHPIHSGLPGTWMVADIEVYRYARGPAENLTVLSYAADRDGTRFPIDWTVEYGAGCSRVETVGGQQSLVITVPVRNGAFFSGTVPATAMVEAEGIFYEIGGSNDLADFNQSVSQVLPALTGAPDMPGLTTGWTYRTFRLDGAVGGATPRGPLGFLRAKVIDGVP